MADSEEKKRSVNPSSGDKPKARASKAKAVDQIPEAEILTPVSEAPMSVSDPLEVGTPGPVSAGAEPIAKPSKKPAKAKKEEAPAVEAPKENLSLNADDI